MAVLEVGTEHLFVVEKSVTSFPGQKERGHSLKDELAIMLLENRAHVDHRVDFRALRRVFFHWRFPCVCEEVRQSPDSGVGFGGVLRAGEGKYPPTSVRLCHVPKVEG